MDHQNVDRITVINVNSLSYTGTTWINLVLGSHETAMALGPLDRFWQVLNRQLGDHWWVVGAPVDALCLVHGHECDFWPGFANKYSTSDNFFVELNRHTGKTVFTTNNISSETLKRMLEDPRLRVLTINLARDGRALVESYLSKHRDKTYVQALAHFLQPSLNSFALICQAEEALFLRYEDLMDNMEESLCSISEYLGINYSRDALRFWALRHHLVGGNPGTIATLRLSEGLAITEFDGREFYEEQFARLKESGPQVFVPRANNLKVSRSDLYFFDSLAGADNARLGYRRDAFSNDEQSAFSSEMKSLISNDHIPEYLLNNTSLLQQDRETGNGGNNVPAKGGTFLRRLRNRAREFLGQERP